MQLNLVVNRGQETLKVNPDMDWNGSFVRPADSPLSFFSNYANNYDQYPYQEMEAKYLVGSSSLELAQGMLPAAMERSYIGNQEKKKRLTSEQLDSLERSFQEEIKLDPDRKMKLSRELGLQPRQIAVWFQNRRARWKNKQLENLYDSLKHDFDVISREKLKLQEEVTKLKAMLRNQATRNQASLAYTEISGEERTVESPSVAMRSSSRLLPIASNENMAVGSNVFPMEDYSNKTVPTPYYWAVSQ